MDVAFVGETPAQLRSHGLHLLTDLTPNGKRVQILVEELRDLYGFTLETHLIDLETDEQKRPWFLRLNPNGRIPILVHVREDKTVSVLESAAIIVYLCELVDIPGKLLPRNLDERTQVLQWLFFWHSNTAIHSQARQLRSANDAAGQAVFAKAKANLAERYAAIESHLSGTTSGSKRDYLAGAGRGRYSAADVAAWPHLNAFKSAGFDEAGMQQYPNLLNWIKTVSEREAVK